MQPTPVKAENSIVFRVLLWAGFLLLVVGIAGFRWQFIDLRPVHTDEAENAYLLANDLAGASYTFNPEHHHGPTLNGWLKFPSFVMGYAEYSEMSMVPFRAAMGLLGLATLGSLWFFKRMLGVEGVLCATSLAGVSAFLTYYGNYVIHETLLGGLAVVGICFLVSFVSKPTGLKAVGIGAIAGLMFATKITSLIYFASWGIAAGAVWIMARGWATQYRLRQWLFWCVLAFVTGMVVSTLLYTSFFRHPSSIWDAIRSLWAYQTEIGHEKPWSYFISDFVFPLHQPPYGSYEWALWGFALAAVIALGISSFRRNMDRSTQRLLVFLLVSSLVQGFLYSMVSYKTPWLMLVTWLQVAMIAGIGFSSIWRLPHRWLKIAGVVVLLVGLVMQIRSTAVLNGVQHSDPRNPLAYAPTSANIERLPDFLSQQLKGFSGPVEVAVYGSFTWPIPWYLREFSNVRYEGTPPSVPTEAVLILTDASYDKVDPKWIADKRSYPFTLRPHFPVYVCISNPDQMSEDLSNHE